MGRILDPFGHEWESADRSALGHRKDDSPAQSQVAEGLMVRDIGLEAGTTGGSTCGDAKGSTDPRLAVGVRRGRGSRPSRPTDEG
jgi:hypothetical protein